MPIRNEWQADAEDIPQLTEEQTARAWIATAQHFIALYEGMLQKDSVRNNPRLAKNYQNLLDDNRTKLAHWQDKLKGISA